MMSLISSITCCVCVCVSVSNVTCLERVPCVDVTYPKWQLNAYKSKSNRTAWVSPVRSGIGIGLL